MNEVNIEIVKMELEHIDDVYEIEKESFDDAWTRESIEAAMKYETEHWFVAFANGSAAGFVGAYSAADEGEILDIAVKKEYRRLGIGARLINHVIDFMRQHGAHLVSLEVRRSNASAIALYEKSGFESVGVRKRYYRNNGEDAIIMIKEW